MMEKLIKQTENEQLMGDTIFRNVIGNEATMTLMWMRLMVEPMASMNDFLDKTDFKKHNPQMEVFLTKKEAKDIIFVISFNYWLMKF